MEEKKKNNEVKMEVVKNSEGKDNSQPPKYTYEQLNDICNKLFHDSQYLRQQLQQANNALKMFNRLDYLFKVVELQYSNFDRWQLFSEDFIHDCIKEIQDAITIPQEEKEEGKEE